MSVAPPMQRSAVAGRVRPSWRVVLLLWLLAGVALGFGVGRPPVQRTQEARVLEVARQMRGTGWRGWLVPRINGTLRLKKPPLAYWMAALAYDVAGVSATAGRWPTVICGWLTVGVTFLASRRAFGSRAGILAAGCLLCSFLFFRHDRLAETDAPAALFVTIAIFAWWRAVDGCGQRQRLSRPGFSPASVDQVRDEMVHNVDPSELDDAVAATPHPPATAEGISAKSCSSVELWFHIGAIATALAILFKGGPGAFPPIFLLALIALRGQWCTLRRFTQSGAPIVLILLAVPWFLYASYATDSGQIGGEVDTLLSGADHYAPFYHYIPELLKAAAPWSLIMLAAIGVAAAPLVSILQSRPTSWSRLRQWAHEPQAVVLVWAFSIFAALCVIGNKQFHYLLPMMPPVMILVGWLLDRSMVAARARVAPAVGFLIDATLFGTVLAAPAVVISAKMILGRVRPVDQTLAVGLGIAAGAVVGLYLWKGRRAALWTFLTACLLLFPPAIGLWVPSMEPDDSVAIAHQIAGRYEAGPYVFYGPNYSLPLCFNLRQAIPSTHNKGELVRAAEKNFGLVVIAQTKTKYPPRLPEGFTEEPPIRISGQLIQIYRGPAKHAGGSD